MLGWQTPAIKCQVAARDDGHTFNSSTQGVEAGESLSQSQPGLHSLFLNYSSLSALSCFVFVFWLALMGQPAARWPPLPDRLGKPSVTKTCFCALCPALLPLPGYRPSLAIEASCSALGTLERGPSVCLSFALGKPSTFSIYRGSEAL